MKFHIAKLFVLVLYILFPYFSANGQFGTTYHSNISQMPNPDSPIYKTPLIELKKIWEITDDDTDFIFGNLCGIDVDENGRVLASDVMENNIKIFSPDGKYIRTFGRKGQGPGEFIHNGGIAVLPENKLLVIDALTSYPKSRFNFFHSNGEFIHSFDALVGNDAQSNKNASKYEQYWSSGKYVESCRYYSPQKLILLVNYYVDLKNQRSADAICLFNLKNQQAHEIFTYPHIEYEDPDYCDDRFYYRLQWACKSTGEIAVFRNNYDYKIDILDSTGALLYVIKRDFKLPVKTKEEYKFGQEKAEKWVNEMRKLGQTIHFRVLKQKPILYSYHTLSRSLFWDDRDWLWVLTNEPFICQKNEKKRFHHTFDVFDPNGKYLMKVPLEARKPFCIVYKNDFLYFVDHEYGEYPRLFKYKIEESKNE